GQRSMPDANRATRPGEVVEERDIPGGMRESQGQRSQRGGKAAEIRRFADQRERAPVDRRWVAEIVIPGLLARTACAPPAKRGRVGSTSRARVGRDISRACL